MALREEPRGASPGQGNPRGEHPTPDAAGLTGESGWDSHRVIRLKGKEMPVTFDKYELRGAYHWQWYESNRFNNHDRVHMMLEGMEHSGTALDIGCGDGLITYKLFEHGLAATGIDNNATSIRLAQTTCAQQIYPRRSEGFLWPDAYDFRFWTPDEFAGLLNGSKFEFMSITEMSMYVKLYP